MATIQVNKKEKKQANVMCILNRFMLLMGIIIATMAFNACGEENGENPDNPDNGSGGITGKRLKTQTQTTGTVDAYVRVEWTYNSDGTIKQRDHYNDSGQKVQYYTYSYNSDGTRNQYKFYNNSSLLITLNYSYDANKKPKQAQGTTTSGANYTFDYTFQNGRKIREVQTTTVGVASVTITFEQKYDANGRRTTTTETGTNGTRQYTRTYNSDGTLQKVTFPHWTDGSTITYTYTWEDGKTTQDEDDFMYW